MAFRLELRSTVTSTNEVLKALARAGEPAGKVLIAEVQTQGRGQRGRRWHSPRGGLWMSVLLRPHLAASRAPALALQAAEAVGQALRGLGLSPIIKPPNDVLVGNNKICGVLVEAATSGPWVEYAVIGIGLNVNNPPPRRTRLPATSVAQELGRAADRLELAESILHHLASASS